MKPLLDGKALAKALSAPPGPWMKDALDVVMAWQLRNPETASAEGAIEEVRDTKLHGELTASLVTHFLRLTIRPLFLKNQHPAVTAQGRKVTTSVLPKKLFMEQSDEVAKPWKGKDVYALDVLHWVISSLDETTAEKNWPMILPPVLSIVDDTDTKYKAAGCQLVSLLLSRTRPSLIARTGLSEIFEDALMPCLGYLPSLTPEDESVTLLSEAYSALMQLSSVMDDPAKTSSAHPSRKTKLLDTLIRKGILTAHTYCSENIKITEVLLRNLTLIIDGLGIESVQPAKGGDVVMTG